MSSCINLASKYDKHVLTWMWSRKFHAHTVQTWVRSASRTYTKRREYIWGGVSWWCQLRRFIVRVRNGWVSGGFHSVAGHRCVSSACPLHVPALLNSLLLMKRHVCIWGVSCSFQSSRFIIRVGTAGDACVSGRGNGAVYNGPLTNACQK